MSRRLTMGIFSKKGKVEDGTGALNVDGSDESFEDMFDVDDADETRLKDLQKIGHKIGKKKYLPAGVTAMKCNGFASRIRGKTPSDHLAAMLTRRNLRPQFDEFLEAVLAPCKKTFHTWKSADIWESLPQEVLDPFIRANISIHLCQTKQWIQHQHGGHYHYVRWFEFIERDVTGADYQSGNWKYGTDGRRMTKTEQKEAKQRYKEYINPLKAKRDAEALELENEGSSSGRY